MPIMRAATPPRPAPHGLLDMIHQVTAPSGFAVTPPLGPQRLHLQWSFGEQRMMNSRRSSIAMSTASEKQPISRHWMTYERDQHCDCIHL